MVILLLNYHDQYFCYYFGGFTATFPRFNASFRIQLLRSFCLVVLEKLLSVLSNVEGIVGNDS